MADSPHPADRNIGQLISDARADLLALLRAEIALAKSEVLADVTRAATGIGLAVLAVICLSGAGIMALFAAAYGLISRGVTHWLAFLIVAGVLLLISGVAALIARSRWAKTARGQRTLTAGRASMSRLQAAGRKSP
ncbi:MAG: phage holin family protein [Angustibacter sp.]